VGGVQESDRADHEAEAEAQELGRPGGAEVGALVHHEVAEAEVLVEEVPVVVDADNF